MATEKKAPRQSMKTGAAAPKGAAKKGNVLNHIAASGGDEICYGCGTVIPPKSHPDLPPNSVIGVMHEEDVDAGWTMIDNPSNAPGEDGQKYVGVPVCLPCHRDPQHRSAHPLKVHFFERIGNAPKMGLMLAGSMSLQG